MIPYYAPLLTDRLEPTLFGSQLLDETPTPELGMNCAHCDFSNPENARFCAGCGQPMPQLCTSCEQPLVPGGRFCAQCGTPVAGAEASSSPKAPATSPPAISAPATEPISQPIPETQVESRQGGDEVASPPAENVKNASSERRQVAILFADIVGSTSMGEEIDPEDLAELINGAFKVMNDAIEAAGGHVGRLMGDGLLAFFGAPISHEDDPLRAVRAGLAICEGIKAYSQEIQGAPGEESEEPGRLGRPKCARGHRQRCGLGRPGR